MLENEMQNQVKACKVVWSVKILKLGSAFNINQIEKHE